MPGQGRVPEQARGRGTQPMAIDSCPNCGGRHVFLTNSRPVYRCFGVDRENPATVVITPQMKQAASYGPNPEEYDFDTREGRNAFKDAEYEFRFGVPNT